MGLIAGQQDQIGLADYMLMAAGVAKGMRLKGVYGVVQNGAWAVISAADNPIRKPQDLIGRSVAVTADHKALLDLLLAVNKIAPEQGLDPSHEPCYPQYRVCQRTGQFVRERYHRVAARPGGPRPAKAKASRCIS